MAGRVPLSQQIVEARRVTVAAEDRARAAEEALEAFKRQVRQEAVEVRKTQNWCLNGFNEVMSNLGLEPQPTHFTVTVKVIAVQEVETTAYTDDLEADYEATENGARKYILDNPDIIDGDVSSFAWEIDPASVQVLTVIPGGEN